MQFRVVFSEEVDTNGGGDQGPRPHRDRRNHQHRGPEGRGQHPEMERHGHARRHRAIRRDPGRRPPTAPWTGTSAPPGGELLAQGDWKRSSGPPVISVADAAVTEGDGAQLAFAVTLDRNWSGPIPTVSYATSDGTASAGSDYTASSGSLTLGWTHTGSLIRPWITGGRHHGARDQRHGRRGNRDVDPHPVLSGMGHPGRRRRHRRHRGR